MFSPSMRSILLALSLSGLVFGQTVLHTDPGAWSGIVSKNVVKDASGALYALSASAPVDAVNQDVASATGPLLLQKSIDSGTTWTTLPFTFNDGNSGLVAPPLGNAHAPIIASLTSHCSLAIDGQGRLHALFLSWSGKFYRNYHPGTGIASQLCYMGPPGPVSGLVVDQSNRVWMVATFPQAGAMDQHLIASNAPFAAGELFTDLGSVSPNGGTFIWETALVVDAAGSIHCVYERDGVSTHRRFVPATGWDASATAISTNIIAKSNRLAADALGHVHCLFVQNILWNSTYPTTTWELRYRQWSPLSGWSPMTPVMDATYAQYATLANEPSIFAIGCDEVSGRATAVYRSIATNGAILVAEKSLSDIGFNVVGQLTPASTNFNEYLVPTIRGSLYPSFNWTDHDLDVTWARRPELSPPPVNGNWYSPSNQIVFSHGLSSWCWISVGTPALIGTSISLPIDCPFDPNAPYALACSLGTSPGIALGPLDGRVIPLNADPLLAYTLGPNPFLSNSTGVLSMAGSGVVGMSIPNDPGLIGFVFYAGFVTLNPTSPSGITFISPARSIQVM